MVGAPFWEILDPPLIGVSVVIVVSHLCITPGVRPPDDQGPDPHQDGVQTPGTRDDVEWIRQNSAPLKVGQPQPRPPELPLLILVLLETTTICSQI